MTTGHHPHTDPPAGPPRRSQGVQDVPMRVCMVLYDVQEFGGLEEYAVNLAIGLRRLGHEVSFLSAAWAPRDNQYRRRLSGHGVPFVQAPKWVSLAASDWDTKVRILDWLVFVATPLVYLLGFLHWIVKRHGWSQSLASARGWLRSQLLGRLLAKDRRESLGRLLLTWWRYRWQPDLLHLHGYTTNLLFAIEWAHARNVPVVYEEHQTPDAQFDWWQGFSHTINKATTVVAVSEQSARALRTVCGVTRPIEVRPPLLPDPLGSAVRPPARHVRDGPVTMTTVARLYVTKGLTYLLQAIPKVTATHPDARFRIYGDGPLHQELLAQATELGLDADAIFRGAFTTRDALADIMADTDVFVMSSILEGQPLGLVEAMAYGCPIVTTSVGGIPELIEDGVNGLLCPPGDVDALASAIRTVVGDPALRERLGREARRSYEQGPFEPLAVGERLASIYSGALLNGRTA